MTVNDWNLAEILTSYNHNFFFSFLIGNFKYCNFKTLSKIYKLEEYFHIFNCSRKSEEKNINLGTEWILFYVIIYVNVPIA